MTPETTSAECKTIGWRDTAAVVKAFASGRMDIWSNQFLGQFGDHFFVPALNFYVLNHPTMAYELLVKQGDNTAKGKYISEIIATTFSHGLISNEGEDWAFTRKLLAKDFSKGTIAHHRNGISVITAGYLEDWRRAAENQDRVDITYWAFKLAFEMISIFLFKKNPAHLFGEVHDSLGHMRDAAQLRVLGPMRHVPIWFPLPVFRRARAARERMHSMVRQLTDEYRRGENRDEIYSRLLPNQVIDKICEQVDSGKRSCPWADGELVILYMAGHETTAMGISWMCHAVANLPELQEQLFENGNNLALDNLDDEQTWEKLALHQQVAEEALRLYPPIPGFSRSYDYDVIIQGTRIPKNSTIAMMQYVIHRHPDFWENPEQFDPERFSPARRTAIVQGAYLPFGLGPRRCIGAEMAVTEMTIVLAYLTRYFRISSLNQRPIYAVNNFTLQPSEKIELKFEARK